MPSFTRHKTRQLGIVLGIFFWKCQDITGIWQNPDGVTSGHIAEHGQGEKWPTPCKKGNFTGKTEELPLKLNHHNMIVDKKIKDTFTRQVET